jgi:hypothetical protein
LEKLLIVALAPIRIAENRISFIELPHFFRSFCFLAGSGKEVRMISSNQLSIGRFDFIGARGALNTENLVEVRVIHESLRNNYAITGDAPD